MPNHLGASSFNRKGFGEVFLPFDENDQHIAKEMIDYCTYRGLSYSVQYYNPGLIVGISIRVAKS